MSDTLDPRLLLRGYAAGIFPMADSRDSPDIFWVEPRTRAILPLDGFKPSRSLVKRIRSGRFEISRDRAFRDVVLACAARDETWINGQIEQATLGLHSAGHAHSIECWQDGELVGGLYGVKLGRAFFGESMFSTVTDASKVALAWLIARLKAGHYTLLDCQFITGHLASLGATTVSRDRYAGLLGSALSSAAGGVVGGTGSTASGVASELPAGLSETSLPPPEFDRLDRLLADAGADGKSGAPGQLIAQLLTQTS